MMAPGWNMAFYRCEIGKGGRARLQWRAIWVREDARDDQRAAVLQGLYGHWAFPAVEGSEAAVAAEVLTRAELHLAGHAAASHSEPTVEPARPTSELEVASRGAVTSEPDGAGAAALTGSGRWVNRRGSEDRPAHVRLRASRSHEEVLFGHARRSRSSSITSRGGSQRTAGRSTAARVGFASTVIFGGAAFQSRVPVMPAMGRRMRLELIAA